jgi:hypothetical protein
MKNIAIPSISYYSPGHIRVMPCYDTVIDRFSNPTVSQLLITAGRSRARAGLLKTKEGRGRP